MQDRITQINEILLHCTAGPYIGSFASIHDGSVYVRFTPDSDRRGDILNPSFCARSGHSLRLSSFE